MNTRVDFINENQLIKTLSFTNDVPVIGDTVVLDGARFVVVSRPGFVAIHSEQSMLTRCIELAVVPPGRVFES